MRTLLLSFALALLPLVGFAQAPLLRNTMTTNMFMNSPQNGWIAIWNNVAQKWSNGVNTASATNDSQPPSTVLSNLTATGVAPGATNASAYIASLSGLGSNTHIKALVGTSRALLVNTNTLVVTNGNVGVGTDAPGSKFTVNGAIGVNGGLNATTVDIFAGTGASFSDDSFVGERALVTGVGPNAAISESVVTDQELNRLSGVTGGIQTNLNNRIANMNGRGTNTTFLNITNNGILTNVGNIWSFGDIIADGGLFANNPSTVSALNVNGIFSSTAGLNEFQQDLTVGGPLQATTILKIGGLGGHEFFTNVTVSPSASLSSVLSLRQEGGSSIMDVINGDFFWNTESFWLLPQWNLNPEWVNFRLGANQSHTTNLLEFLNESPSENAGAVSAFNAAAALVVGALVDASAGPGDISITNNFYLGGRIIADKWAAIIWGSGSPEGSIAANVGSVFYCTNGCTSSGAYVKTNGTGNTGWWLIQGGGSGGSGTPAGNSGAVQFNEGGSFAGTNRFNYDRTNEVLSLVGSSAGSVRLYDNDSSHSVNLIGNAALSSNLNLTFPNAMSNGVLTVVSVNDSNFNIAVVPSSSFGAGEVTTAQLNTSSNTVRAISIRPDFNTFWDDFEGRSILQGTNLGVSPSGHQWHMYSFAAGGTTTLSNGMWRGEGTASDQPWYAAISNGTPGLKWHRWGQKVLPIFNASGFSFDITAAMILSDNFPAFGDDPTWLHVAVLPTQIYFQQKLGTVMYQRYFEVPLPLDEIITFEFQAWSNTVSYSIGPYRGSFTHPDMHLYGGNGKTFQIWENYPSVTNSTILAIDSAWAGQIEPDLIPFQVPVASTFLRGTNRWFDGGISSIYTNTFIANSGGVSNILATNILDGSITRLEFLVDPGVTVGFPGVSAAMWGGAVPFFATNAGLWNIVEVSKHGTVTNYRHSIEGFDLATGYKTRADTNFVSRTITFGSNERLTNYADGNITIDCSTDVTANYTNAVAGNRSITLATPVIGTSGSLGLVSDGSARTLPILSPVAITWLSTNDTATATNILTTASKRSLFAWRVGMGTDGVSTNLHCWVKNQTP